MTPRHHPTDEFLMDYAFGSAREPVALAVATHLAYCAACRSAVARYEDAAGAMLGDAEATEIGEGALQQVLDRLDMPEAGFAPATDVGHVNAAGGDDVPSPLRRYIDVPLERLPWRRRGRAFYEHRLLPDFSGYNVKLLRIPSGHGTPFHRHEGTELTVVLSGGFRDESGHYLVGDLAQVDQTVMHSPVADDDGDCICLAVTDGEIHLAGPIGKLLDPFVRY